MNEEKDDRTDDYADLRQRAEAAFPDQTGADVAQLNTEEAQRLVYELQVHQIELEMQNEELRQAQNQLAESRDQFSDLYDFAPVGYLTIGKKGLIRQANLTAAALLGVHRGDLLKSPFSRFIIPADQDIFYRHRRQVLETENGQSCELRLLKADGMEFAAQLESTAVPANQGLPGQYRTIISDITERKQAEAALQAAHEKLEQSLAELKETQAQLMQQERLAAVGQMAAGIAHDFNNLMATVILYSDLLLKTATLAANDRAKVATIRQQGWRAAELTQQILDFGRRSPMERHDLDLCPFLEEQKTMLARILPGNILLTFTSLTQDCWINADPTRLQQAIINLAINAGLAMPSGGHLHIELAHLNIGADGNAQFPRLAAGDWAQVQMMDTGSGIAPDVLPHIFEPFFTTRSPLGSGLGLSQVYGIIKQHHGEVDVATTVGEGTTFALFLPALPTQSAPEAAESAALAMGQGETVLVVEDDESLRQVMVESLELLNYQVICAANGRDALAIYQEKADEIALIVSDLIMPGIGGLELTTTLRQKNPSAKVLIVTGYPSKEIKIDLKAASVNGWLQKPINLETLAQTIAAIL